MEKELKTLLSDEKEAVECSTGNLSDDFTCTTDVLGEETVCDTGADELAEVRVSDCSEDPDTEYLDQRAAEHISYQAELDARFDACINTLEERIEHAAEERKVYEDFIKENTKFFNRDLIVNVILSVIFICLFFLNVDILLSFLGLLYFFISLLAMFIKNMFFSDPADNTSSKLFSVNMVFVFLGVLLSLPMLNDTATGPVTKVYPESNLYLMEDFGFDYLCVIDKDINCIALKLPVKKNISRFFKEAISDAEEDSIELSITYFPSSGLVESIAVLDSELDTATK